MMQRIPAPTPTRFSAASIKDRSFDEEPDEDEEDMDGALEIIDDDEDDDNLDEGIYYELAAMHQE